MKLPRYFPYAFSAFFAASGLASFYIPTLAQEKGTESRSPRPSDRTHTQFKTSQEFPGRAISLRNALSQGAMEFAQCIVVAPETFEISAQETGTISELSVSENSHVSKGMTLGRLHTETLELEKEVASLQYQVAQAESLDDGDVRFAEKVLEEAKLQQEAYDLMGGKGDASPLEVRQKRIASEQAKVRLTQAKAAKVQKELKARLAEASLLVADKKLQRLRLESPAEGLVVRIDRRVGEWVSAGTPVLKIVRMDELRVDFFVDIHEIAPSSLVGKEVSVSVLGNSDEADLFRGTIAGFAPDVSSTQKVRMTATIRNSKSNGAWSLLPGMGVKLRTIETQRFAPSR